MVTLFMLILVMSSSHHEGKKSFRLGTARGQLMEIEEETGQLLARSDTDSG
jgi:hypothetical protein